MIRMEKLEMKSWTTQVKIIGSVITIAGALVVVLYKGPVQMRSPTSSASVFAQQPALVNVTTAAEQSDWIKGGALLAADYVIASVWYIYQVKDCRKIRMVSEFAVRLSNFDNGLEKPR